MPFTARRAALCTQCDTGFWQRKSTRTTRDAAVPLARVRPRSDARPARCPATAGRATSSCCCAWPWCSSRGCLGDSRPLSIALSPPKGTAVMCVRGRPSTRLTAVENTQLTVNSPALPCCGVPGSPSARRPQPAWGRTLAWTSVRLPRGGIRC